MCAIIKAKGPTKYQGVTGFFLANPSLKEPQACVFPVKCSQAWRNGSVASGGKSVPSQTSMSISCGDLLGNKQGAAYPIISERTGKLGVGEKLIWFHLMWISPALMKIQRNKNEKHQISSHVYLEHL